MKDAKRAGMGVHGREGQACPAVWYGGPVRVPGQPELSVLPGVPDRRKGTGGPALVEVAEVTAGERPTVPAEPGEVVYRGVRWRRSASSERISWFNEGLGRWVVWVPKSDAPPLPPEYASLHFGRGPCGPGRRARHGGVPPTEEHRSMPCRAESR